MTTRISRSSAAVALTAALAAAGLGAAAAAPGAHASPVSDVPCNTSVQLAKVPMYAWKGGPRVADLYVSDEGSQLCAVTRAVGTYYGNANKIKSMEVSLTTGGQTADDPGPYHSYAGRVRLPVDKINGCFAAYGKVTLTSGKILEAYRPLPRYCHMSMPA